MLSDFYKNKSTDKIWWTSEVTEVDGTYETDYNDKFLFSFDKEQIFDLFQDYPYKLTEEQKKIFDKENPYWADFFKDRQK